MRDPVQLSQTVPSSGPILNLAAYRFFDLPSAAQGGLEELRAKLKSRMEHFGVRGTILLSPEGVNLFVAGWVEQTESFFEEFKSYVGLFDLEAKRSFSDRIPFARALVKLKREIISLGMDFVKPSVQTGPRVEPEVLKEWLDRGEKVVLIDTRNDYEFKMGHFKGSVNLDLKSFREFPEKLKAWKADHTDELKGAKVVMFCTGGIRCEKATVVGDWAGLENSFQLEGGILKYFEKVGGAHWDGGCFVFDERVVLKSDLTPGKGAVCFACREPLTEMEMRSPDYIVEVSCPYCVKAMASKKSGATELASRAV